MKTIFNLILIFGMMAFVARAQDEVPPPAPGYQSLSAAQLDQLLGPIALYPDPLISIILPASTFPTEIVLADRYVSGGGDPNLIDQQSWDASVQALAHYPQVLSWMDNNLNWTTQMGQAFEYQQQDVMDSIQHLRTEAYNLGNLQSTPQQQIVDDNGNIEILPVNPDDLYVPEYQPDQVYYQSPYGAPFITFSVGFPIGPWLCADFDWRNHNLVFWDRSHPRPAGWWQERPEQRSAYFAGRAAPVWRPAARPASSAGYQSGDRGWNNQLPWTAPPVNRSAPAPAERFDNYQRPENNAFIGIQSSHDTRTFSDRGQQSMEAIPHSSPAYHGAPSSGGGFHGGGGGGGSGGRR